METFAFGVWLCVCTTTHKNSHHIHTRNTAQQLHSSVPCIQITHSSAKTLRHTSQQLLPFNTLLPRTRHTHTHTVESRVDDIARTSEKRFVQLVARRAFRCFASDPQSGRRCQQVARLRGRIQLTLSCPRRQRIRGKAE